MMLRRNDRNLENIPVGALGLIALDGCTEMGAKVNDYLVKWRKEDGHVHKNDVAFTGYEKDTYLIDAKVPRFGSGEAKGIINESVRGKDLYLMVDVCNYSLTYSLTGNVNHMSPDDHFQNLKRIIAAVGGKGRRINVIMPFLYESRQHKRGSRESLDCAPFKYLIRIVVPLSKPIIAVLVLYYGVARWNSYQDAILYLQKANYLQPLQIILREILIMNDIDETMMGNADALARQRGLKDLLQYSVIVIASVPVMIIYPFVQKYFVKGVMIGAVKG